MKKIFCIVLCNVLFNIAKAQPTISPSQNGEYCPSTEYTFTATITKAYSSMIGEGGASVTQLPQSPVGTTFTFKGKFADANQKQTFRINHPDNTYTLFDFKRIKSLFYSTPCAQIPNQATITVPRCQIVNIPVSVANVQWGTTFENPILCFGSISTFEYRLPSGWSIGASVSNGSNWIAGGGSVTVTSDLTNGNGGAILIRPRNNCGSGLSNGQTPGQIPISRPRTVTGITGDNFICSGSKNYSISGTLPSGATVCWSSSNTNYATVPASNCGTTIPLTFVAPGAVTLTATVTDCFETYTITKNITIGAAVAGYYRIASDYHNYGIFYPLYNNNSTIFLPANKTFGVDVQLTSPGTTATTWSRASSSYPFNWSYNSTYNTFSFYGASGTAAYESRGGMFNLTAQTACGAYSGTFSWTIVVQGWSFTVVASPNPATSNLQVTIKDQSAGTKTLTRVESTLIELHDFNTAAVVKSWHFKNDNKQFNLNISDVRKGRYILVVKKGKDQQSTQIVVD